MQSSRRHAADAFREDWFTPPERRIHVDLALVFSCIDLTEQFIDGDVIL
jgi:hypothetical protein